MKSRNRIRALVAAAALLTTVGARANAPDNRYQPGAAGELQDTITGLVWQVPPDTSKYDNAGAQAHCVAPWRLPTTYELMTIIDYWQPVSPMVDQQFVRVDSDWYWTSEVQVGNNTEWWQVTFDYDPSAVVQLLVTASGTVTAYVMCVRSS
jgi:hypothetical protein